MTNTEKVKYTPIPLNAYERDLVDQIRAKESRSRAGMLKYFVVKGLQEWIDKPKEETAVERARRLFNSPIQNESEQPSPDQAPETF